MKLLVLFLFLLVFSACSSNNKTASSGSSRTNRSQAPDSSSLDDLIKEVLDATCNEKHKQSFEARIKQNRGILTPAEMKKNLKIMKNNIKCS